jgi:hypothetical protein
MSEGRFEVTFIRGRRDETRWQTRGREMVLSTNSPQAEVDAVHARSHYYERAAGVEPRQYPNCIYNVKGRQR